MPDVDHVVPHRSETSSSAAFLWQEEGSKTTTEQDEADDMLKDRDSGPEAFGVFFEQTFSQDRDLRHGTAFSSNSLSFLTEQE